MDGKSLVGILFGIVLIIIMVMINRKPMHETHTTEQQPKARKWWQYLLGVPLLILSLVLFAVSFSDTSVDPGSSYETTKQISHEFGTLIPSILLFVFSLSILKKW
jgi:VanZ family protein